MVIHPERNDRLRLPSRGGASRFPGLNRSTRFPFLLVWAVAIIAISTASVSADEKKGKNPSDPYASDAVFKQSVLPILQDHCLDCHDADTAEGDIDFSGILEAAHVLEHREDFVRAGKQLSVAGMPPEDSGMELTEDESRAIKAWLDWKLYRVDCDLVNDVGWVSIHRLNRSEYNNTIRDLFGIDLQPANDFPVDTVGHGFTNMGEALTLPLMLLEKYINASEDVAQAVVRARPEGGEKIQFSDTSLKTSGSVSDAEAGFKKMYSAGSVYGQQEFKDSGEYLIRIEAAAEQAGPDLAKMEIRIDGKKVNVIEVRGDLEPRYYELKRSIEAGVRKIEVAFINDYYQPQAEDPGDRDRNLGVRVIEVSGPIDVELPESHRRVVIAKPQDGKTVKQAAREVFARLMPRVFRRPVDDVEVDRIVKLVAIATERGETFERGVQVGVQRGADVGHRRPHDAPPRRARRLLVADRDHA